jgi:thioredoxin 1
MSKHPKQYATYSNLGPKVEKPMYPAHIIVTDAETRQKMISNNTIVCIDLYAEWCRPCKVVSPKFMALAETYNSPGKCLLVKENIDHKLTTDCKITGIPAFIFYHNGKILKNEDGSNVIVIGGNITKVKEILDELLARGE